MRRRSSPGRIDISSPARFFPSSPPLGQHHHPHSANHIWINLAQKRDIPRRLPCPAKCCTLLSFGIFSDILLWQPATIWYCFAMFMRPKQSPGLISASQGFIQQMHIYKWQCRQPPTEVTDGEACRRPLEPICICYNAGFAFFSDADCSSLAEWKGQYKSHFYKDIEYGVFIVP